MTKTLDLSKSIPFYQKLGLELIVEALPHYARFKVYEATSKKCNTPR